VHEPPRPELRGVHAERIVRFVAQRGFTLAELNASLEGIEISAIRPHRAVTATRIL